MRADRLLSIVILLQTKGPLTAKELASECEVSERTICRDIDALSISDVPVYGSPGPDGGYNLLDHYKTDLTGLNKDEIQALFHLNIPHFLQDIGMSTQLKSAFLKLQAALPHSHEKFYSAGRRVYFDPASWPGTHHSAPSVQQIYRAIINNQKCEITYLLKFFNPVEITCNITPYGLVSKTNNWFLIYATEKKINVINVQNLIHITLMDERFVYPDDFNLVLFWKEWCCRKSTYLKRFHVTILVPDTLKDMISRFIQYGDYRILQKAPLLEKINWEPLELWFDTFEQARNTLLSLGGAVKVIEPAALQYSLIDYAEQILGLYKE
ncbi:MAG: WYL domain-containing protein [Spirochaetales bacterium]|nr:WYL domain-containing protein [Spirochaetales bacterium]